MKKSPLVPRVAFILQLRNQTSNAADLARIKHIVHLLRGHRLPCTWSVSSCSSLELPLQNGILQPYDNLALILGSEGMASPNSANQFRTLIRSQLEAMQTCSGVQVQFVAGEPATLRPYAAILAEQGIRAILTNTRQRCPSSQAPLPCGLWQMNIGTVDTSALRIVEFSSRDSKGATPDWQTDPCGPSPLGID